ncbi:hypothetical protein HanIR_Chr02g0093831 [Helianthus annuus]|nr:hypothetical protein HanIR_Chr02g0093831 [Helianthus annuus]
MNYHTFYYGYHTNLDYMYLFQDYFLLQTHQFRFFFFEIMKHSYNCCEWL